MSLIFCVDIMSRESLNKDELLEDELTKFSTQKTEIETIRQKYETDHKLVVKLARNASALFRPSHDVVSELSPSLSNEIASKSDLNKRDVENGLLRAKILLNYMRHHFSQKQSYNI